MHREEQIREISRRVNTLIQSGEEFTVDRIWRDNDPFTPAEHRAWLGRHIQELAYTNAIRCVGWEETERSIPHSRPARIWQATSPSSAA